MVKERRPTNDVRGEISCELVVDALITQTFGELIPIQESIGKQTPNVRQYRHNYCAQPYSPHCWQALRQRVIERQETPLD